VGGGTEAVGVEERTSFESEWLCALKHFQDWGVFVGFACGALVVGYDVAWGGGMETLGLG
jgi:hypothetical protein